MEKLLYALWRSASEGRAAFRERLIGDLAPGLLDAGALGLQVNVDDDAVAAAAPSRIESSRPPPDGLLTLWLHSASARAPHEAAVAAAAHRIAGYSALESEPMPNTACVAPEGERTPGYSQVVFIQKPDRMHYADWLDFWQRRHGPVAMEVQSNFRYVQNVVVRALTYQAPRLDAIVEECFPAEAMTDRQAFYDALGDEQKFRKNEKAMLDSCAQFLDFKRLDCIPTSEYVVKKIR